MEIKTLNDVFFEVAGRDHDRAMLVRRDGVWTPIASAQLRRSVLSMARQLQSWGVGQGDRVAVAAVWRASHRPEWAITDFATLLLGAIVVPIYATQTAEQVLYVLQHSDARIAVVSSRNQFGKVQSVQAESKLERIVVMDDVEDMPDVPQMRYILNGLD